MSNIRRARREILKSEDIGASAQVLQKSFVQAKHPGREDRIRQEEAIRFVEALCEFPVREAGPEKARSEGREGLCVGDEIQRFAGYLRLPARWLASSGRRPRELKRRLASKLKAAIWS
jgi:hypothetical protein